MIKKILFSLLLGLILTLFIAQNSQWVKQEVAETLCAKLEEVMACCVTCKPHSLNIFFPEIVFNDFCMRSRTDGEWQWKCSRYITHFSWWHLLWHGSLDLHITVDNYSIESTINQGRLAIDSHLQELFAAPLLPVPTFLKSVVINNACFSVRDDENSIIGRLFFNLSSKQFGDTVKTSARITDGSLSVEGREIGIHLKGTIKSGIDGVSNATSLAVDCCCDLPQLAQPACFITGSWKDGSGRFAVRHIDKKIALEPIIITKRHNNIWINVVGRFPLAYVWRLLSNNPSSTHVTGDGSFAIRGSLDASRQCDGELVVQNMRYDGTDLCSAYKMSFNRRHKCFKGEVQARTHAAEIDGIWQYKPEAQTGTITLKNSRTISVPWVRYWQIDPQKLSLTLSKKDGIVAGSYFCNSVHTASDALFCTQGSITVVEDIFKASGSINERDFLCEGSFAPRFFIKQLLYSSAQGKPLITLSSKGDNWKQLSGHMHYSFIRLAMRTLFNYDLQGEGTVCVDGGYNKNKIEFNLHLSDGTIRLPQTYNFINNFDTHIEWDTKERSFVVSDFICGLHMGSAHILHAIATFDRSGNLTFAHIPLVLDRCLLNIKRDLFAVASGSLLFSKKDFQATSFLRGQIMLDRAQLKENMFSLDAQKRLMHNAGTLFAFPDLDIDLDVSIETKHPIRIDTPLFEADAAVNLTIKNSVSDPGVSGSISLLAGKIMFPYKPLHIIKGGIQFVPGQLYNPMVQLVAKNNIKKYSVSLQANGFLQDHHVILDSTPPLTEDQIVSLLLVGSQQDSLNIMMPALIAQNLKMALFGMGQDSFLDKYFKRASTPFNISLVPSFTDQSGRGGLRGGVEISVNDRWRALIQKNFSLSEDTRFELEYLLSDDISARAVRDERCDIGGEIEMRWKF